MQTTAMVTNKVSLICHVLYTLPEILLSILFEPTKKEENLIFEGRCLVLWCKWLVQLFWSERLLARRSATFTQSAQKCEKAFFASFGHQLQRREIQRIKKLQVKNERLPAGVLSGRWGGGGEGLKFYRAVGGGAKVTIRCCFQRSYRA